MEKVLNNTPITKKEQRLIKPKTIPINKAKSMAFNVVNTMNKMKSMDDQEDD